MTASTASTSRGMAPGAAVLDAWPRLRLIMSSDAG
jgi:hypothetical protein